MFPVLIDLGTWNLPFIGETPISLPTYGFLFAISVVAGWSWFARRSRSLGVDRHAERPGVIAQFACRVVDPQIQRSA